MREINSHNKLVLEHLRSRDEATGDTQGITSLEAIGLYRCYRLGARIYDLREQGHKITSIRKVDKTGKVYAKYYLGTNKYCYREGSVFSMPRARK